MVDFPVKVMHKRAGVWSVPRGALLLLMVSRTPQDSGTGHEGDAIRKKEGGASHWRGCHGGDSSQRHSDYDSAVHVAKSRNLLLLMSLCDFDRHSLRVWCTCA